MLTAEQRRENRLASHKKYNRSTKGQRRNRNYEKRHPERAVRWEQNRARNDKPC